MSDLLLLLVILSVSLLLVVGMGGKPKDDIHAGSTSEPVIYVGSH